MEIICYGTGRQESPQDSIKGVAHCQKVNHTFWIEMNLQLTRDDVLILFHDHHLVLNQNPYEIRNIDYLQLEDYQIGHGETIPKLETVLSLFPDAKFIFDFHTIQPRAIELFIDLIDNSGYTGEFIIACENDRFLDDFKNEKPTWSFAAGSYEAKKIAYAGLIGLERFAPLKSGYLLIPYQYNGIRILNPRIVKKVKRENKKLFVWMKELNRRGQSTTVTIDSKSDYDKLVALGVDGVFTDYPSLLQGVIYNKP